MKRNIVVSLRASFIGFGMLLILLSVTVLVGARRADVRSDASLVAYAAGGDLDPTFGSGGKVTTDFNGQSDTAHALAIQSDGKIVAAGYGGGGLALTRYTITGTLDSSFGTGGKVTTDFPGFSALAYALAIQSDGKIIAAGHIVTGTIIIDFMLARYNSNGTLDSSFGTGGKVTTDFPGFSALAYALAIQSDGKIIAAGHIVTGTIIIDFMLARYNSNGTLDSSFGTGGKVTTDFNGGIDEAYALAIQSDGKIVAAGRAFNATGDSTDFGLARYNANGTLDGSFGIGGKVTTDFNGQDDDANALAIQSDGKIVAAGFAQNADRTSIYFALARYNANGTLDVGFGSGGTLTNDVNGNAAFAYALAIQRDGQIVAAGSARNVTFPSDFALARYTITGTLDVSFGGGTGKVTTDFNGADSANALGIQSDGKIVAAGIAYNAAGTSADFALARYTITGTLDMTFGSGGTGKVTTDFNGQTDSAAALAIQSDGKIVAAGSAVNAAGESSDFALARYQSAVGIQDLTSSPGPAANHVVLSWTAPDTGGGTPASAYDLRYSNVPINDSTWLTANQAIGEPPPAAPGITETLSYPGFASGTRWYFALKFQDFLGTWSALSNVPSLLDIGFRPQTNGYRFANYTDNTDTDLTFDDLIKLINSQPAVCYNPIGPCIPRTAAAAWRTAVLNVMTKGHCEGMSVSSLRFFKGIDDPASFQSGATDAHDLAKLNARRDTAYYFVPQLDDPLFAYKDQQRQKTPSANLSELSSALSGTASDPMNLFIRFAGLNGGGHAITPYAVEERSDHFEVWVYNSNTPDLASSVLITTTSESWSYNMGSLGIWSGNASTQSLGVVPISQSALPMICPWCPPGTPRAPGPRPSGQARSG